MATDITKEEAILDKVRNNFVDYEKADRLNLASKLLEDFLIEKRIIDSDEFKLYCMKVINELQF